VLIDRFSAILIHSQIEVSQSGCIPQMTTSPGFQPVSV
jgi:hypothetical protein